MYLRRLVVAFAQLPGQERVGGQIYSGTEDTLYCGSYIAGRNEPL
jgi:hypothetical protein